MPWRRWCRRSMPVSPRRPRGRRSAWPTRPPQKTAGRFVPRNPGRGAEPWRGVRRRKMNGSPKIGTAAAHTFVVEPKHAIDFADDRMPAVLCTPWLIWFLEHAARAAVLPFLEADESTV